MVLGSLNPGGTKKDHNSYNLINTHDWFRV